MIVNSSFQNRYPHNTQAVNDYQEQAIQATREITDSYLESQKEIIKTFQSTRVPYVENSYQPSRVQPCTLLSSQSSQKKFVMFSIDDNGPEVTQDQMNNLFKKFYQVDAGFRRKHGGTGLGLSICRGLVEAHGGKLWYDKNHNAGASFKFIIPRNK